MFSFEVKQIKPEPEIYHSLLERFHLRAEECVFLDDRQNNVDGAIACGISPFVLPATRTPDRN